MIDADTARSLFSYNKITGELRWRSTGRRAGTLSEKGYRRVQIDGHIYREHRLIWLIVTGQWPEDQIDHDNQNRADNRWENLVDATQTKNQRNRTLQKNNTSGTPGVTWHKKDKRWRARIKVKGKYVDLGGYATKEAAHYARKEAEILQGFNKNHGNTKTALATV